MSDINEMMPNGENIEEIEDFDGVVVMEDEDGNEVEFEFLDVVEYEGESYAVLLPPDDDEVVILHIEPLDDETEEYTGIDDEELLKKVFELFREAHKDDFNFAED